MDTFFPGDEVVVRLRVKEVKDKHVLTECLQEPVREFWFMGSVLERTKQGALSIDTEQRNAGVDAPAPALVAGNENQAAPTKKDEAIAHVMKVTECTKEDAVKIVEEQGTATILADRDSDLHATVDIGAAVTNQQVAGETA